MTDWLKEIGERMQKASPGPWKHIDGNLGWVPFGYTISDDGVHASIEDAEFVTHAREDVLRLMGCMGVVMDLLAYLDEMGEVLPASSTGRFSQREPLALRDRLRKALEGAGNAN